MSIKNVVSLEKKVSFDEFSGPLGPPGLVAQEFRRNSIVRAASALARSGPSGLAGEAPGAANTNIMRIHPPDRVYSCKCEYRS